MTNLYGNAPEYLAILGQDIPDALVHFLENCQQSTLWIGNTEDTAITKLVLRENNKKIAIEAWMPDIDITTLKVKVSRETVIIQGRMNHTHQVEGYFYPSRFQSLIPLPYLVDPKTVKAEYKNGVLIIFLPVQIESSDEKIQVKVELQ